MNASTKTLLFTIIITLFVLASSSQENNRNLIKVNPFGAFASAIPVSYERIFHDSYSYSVVLGGAIITNKSGSGQSTYNNSGFAISPEARYYMYKDLKYPAKIYIGGYFNYEEHFNTTLDRFKEAIDGFAIGRGGGFLFGNQWFFDNGFILDMYIGPGYMKFERTEEYDLNLGKSGMINSITGQKNTGTKIKFGFTLGISF